MRQTVRYAAALLGTLAAACTCELTLGPGTSQDAPPTTTVMSPAHSAPVVEPVGPQQVSTTDLGLKGTPALPEATGTLTDASVRKTAARHQNEVKFCMEQDGTKTAKLQVAFLVMPDGKVHEQIDEIERSGVSDKLRGCLLMALKRWKFEAPQGGPALATLTMHR